MALAEVATLGSAGRIVIFEAGVARLFPASEARFAGKGGPRKPVCQAVAAHRSAQELFDFHAAGH